jgi:hypothetical protein
MGQVWMGRRATLGGEATKVVAVKLLGGDHADDPRYRSMFVQEARISMLLSHSNVVQVFDAGEEQGNAYMVMEWVDGVNLSQLTRTLRERGEAIPLAVVGYVISEVLRGLAYAQTVTHAGSRIGVVHRAVSPPNVLLSVSGEVKLADFGVARLAAEDTSGLSIKGKLRYMAPEQLSGRSNDPRVDLYAVGALLHELLDNRRFRDEAVDDAHLAGLVTSGTVPPLHNEGVPRELEALRVALLQPDPEARVATADEALELLERWPGLSNAASRLAALVRGLTRVDAPRSGVHAAASPVAELDQSAQRGAAGAATRAQTETRTMHSQASARGKIGALVLLASLVGASVAALGIVVLGGGAAEPTTGEAAMGNTAAPRGMAAGPGEAAESPPGPQPMGTDRAATSKSSPAAADEPTGTEDATPADTPAGASIGPGDAEGTDGSLAVRDGGDPEAAATRTSKTAHKSKSRVEIDVRASALGWADVRIGGVRKTAEPNARFHLRPGSHGVFVKAQGSDGFAKAGTVRVVAGQPSIVRLTADPLGISQTRR